MQNWWLLLTGKNIFTRKEHQNVPARSTVPLRSTGRFCKPCFSTLWTAQACCIHDKRTTTLPPINYVINTRQVPWAPTRNLLTPPLFHFIPRLLYMFKILEIPQKARQSKTQQNLHDALNSMMEVPNKSILNYCCRSIWISTCYKLSSPYYKGNRSQRTNWFLIRYNLL